MGNCTSLVASPGEEQRSPEVALPASEPGKERRSEPVAPPETLVKIRIGRRQLEALQRTAGGGGALPLHLVLAHLLPGADRDELLRRARQWRPVLHSISEVGD